VVRICRWSIVCCSILFLSASAALAKDARVPSIAARPFDQSEDTMVFQGYFTGKYTYRTAGAAGSAGRDQDAVTELRLDVSRPRTNAYEFHFFGAVRDELSNRLKTGDAFTPLADAGNTYASRAHGYLYEAHLDLNNPFGRVTQVRIGRQDGTRDEPVFFDGIAADISLASRLGMTAYGGTAVHLYELNNHPGDNSLQGAGLDILASSLTLVSIDFLHTDGQQDLFDATGHHDQLVSLRLNQRFSPNLRTNAKIRYVNGAPRDMNLRVAATAPDLGLETNAAYARQFRVQNELSNELSPYYEVLGQSDPYQSYDISLRKFIGARYTVDLGYFQRSLINQGQENVFNHSFQRIYAVFDINDLFTSNLTLSLTGEQWRSTPQNVNSAGFDLGYAFRSGRRSPKLSIGSYYSLYKNDFTTSLGERSHVRTYYLKGEYPFARHYAISGEYDLEKGTLEYQTARMAVRYDF